jgi:hypothetical protein
MIGAIFFHKKITPRNFMGIGNRLIKWVVCGMKVIMRVVLKIAKKNAPVIILRRPMRPKLHRDDLCIKAYHVKEIYQEPISGQFQTSFRKNYIETTKLEIIMCPRPKNRYNEVQKQTLF